jgi:hypothetical protein
MKWFENVAQVRRKRYAGRQSPIFDSRECYAFYRFNIKNYIAVRCAVCCAAVLFRRYFIPIRCILLRRTVVGNSVDFWIIYYYSTTSGNSYDQCVWCETMYSLGYLFTEKQIARGRERDPSRVESRILPAERCKKKRGGRRGAIRARVTRWWGVQGEGKG